MGLGSFVLRRLALMVVVLFGITLITFVISHMVPADPVAAYLGPQAPQSEVQEVRREYGLDKPLPEQYAIYLNDLLHGNMGIAIHDDRPVAEDIATYLPATIELAGAAMIVAIVLGITLGVVAALGRDRLQDHLSRLFALSGVSLPVFFLALLLLGVFYDRLGWMPGPGELSPYTVPPARITGMVAVDALIEGNWGAFADAIHHLILPAFVLGLYTTAIIMRMTRSSMLDVLRQDYIRTARAKGASRMRVVVRHGLRNAMIPTVTVIGLAFGGLLSGSVLTETIFSWPGIGRYATDSVVTLDIPAIMGVTIVAAVVYSIANLIVDILYGVLDPRIREA